MNTHLLKNILLLTSLLTFISGPLPAAVHASQQEWLNMTQCVQKALQNNKQIQAFKYQLEASRAGKKSSQGAFGPSLNANYGYTHQDQEYGSSSTPQLSSGADDQWTLGLQLKQPLFRGFALLSAYQQAQLEQDRNRFRLEQAKLDIVLEVQKAFLELLKAREEVEIARDSLKQLKSHLRVAKAFYDVGVKPKFDVLQAEVDVSTAEQELLVAKNRVATQEARLNTLLDAAYNASLNYTGQLTYTPFSLELEDCVQRSLKKRPDLEIARKSVAIARKQTLKAKSPFYPQLDLTVDHLRYGDEPAVDGFSQSGTMLPENEWKVGGQLQWQLFNSGETYYKYRQSKHNIARLNAELQSLKRDAALAVKTAYLQMNQSSESIQVARKGLQEAQEGYRIALKRYQAQVGTSTDVLDAQARLTRSKGELNTALANYKMAMAQLYQAMGEMNMDLK
jgi:outer membrane protein TolC